MKRGGNTNAPCAMCKYGADEETAARMAQIETRKRQRQGRRVSIVLCPQHLIAYRSFTRGRP